MGARAISLSGLLAALLCAPLLWPRPAEAQLQTIATDHFRIHFTDGAEGTARRVAEVAEEVFPGLAAAYQYYDEYSTIHIVVLDNSDQLGNGSADYYSNTVVIWATNLDFELRGSHDWIKNVVTHELAHIITLNKARKKWPFQFALISVSRFDSNPDISFNFPLYHLNAPRGWSEGIAQYGAYKFGYDRWDSHRDMLLRMAVLEDDLLSYDEMGTVLDRTGKYYGELVYNQGFAMLLYIQDQYGAEKVDALTHHFGSMSFDPAIQRVLGISANQFYDDWKAYLKDKYERQTEEVRRAGFFEGEDLARLNEGIIEYYPAYSPDGKKLAYITSEKRDFAIPQLKIHDFETGEKKKLKGYVDTRVAFSPDGEQIVFTRSRGGFNDLYIYDLEEDEERPISARLRAKDPSFSPDGKRIVFVHNEDGTNNLGLINRDGTGRVFLTNNNDATQYSAPRFSPDGRWILFSIFRGEDRDIALISADAPTRPKDYGVRERSKERPRMHVHREDGPVDTLEVFPDSVAFAHPDTSGFRALLNSRADERDPWWLPDGSGFVFASDRSGIFNIYKYSMESGQVEQLTNVVGGAFAPTVSATGEVVYSGYHANDYSLYRFSPGGYQSQVRFEGVAARDYRSIFEGPRLSEEFEVGRYGGRQIFQYIPILQIGPTYVGNTFGLNQVSGGVQFSTGEMFGGSELTAWGVLGKNMRDATDFNTDYGFYYERSLLPRVGNNRTFNPTFYVAARRREIDNLIKTSDVQVDTVPATTIYPVPVDSVNLLIPDAEQHVYQGTSRQDLFKTVLGQLAAGIEMPLTGRQNLSLQYLYRDYAESWTLRSFRSQNKVFVVQDGVDISGNLPPELLSQDTLLVDRDDNLNFYNSLDFYHAHTFTASWRYARINPTAERMMNPTGRVLAFIFRYHLPTVADSLTQQTSPDNVPRDQLARVPQRFRVNEYVAGYNERIGLPFDNSLSFEVVGAYRNIHLKPSFIQNGGFFEGRFYWPLRYYLGGQNFLSGYPYFTDSGSKLLYGRVSYAFPVLKRLSTRFFNFTFSKVYAELFAEAGAVGNFRDLEDIDFNTDSFLTDVGGEMRMQIFSFYRIPMYAFFQMARPLNRERVHDMRAAQLGRPVREDEKIDRWRYYFGFGI